MGGEHSDQLEYVYQAMLQEELALDQAHDRRVHHALESERDLVQYDSQHGYDHAASDQRIHELELQEQTDAAQITADKQAIEDWNRAHPDALLHAAADVAATVVHGVEEVWHEGMASFGLGEEQAHEGAQ